MGQQPIAPRKPTPRRLELVGALAGYSITVWPRVGVEGYRATTSGTLATLDAMGNGWIVGGSLPHGTDRAGLLKLTARQFRQLHRLWYSALTGAAMEPTDTTAAAATEPIRIDLDGALQGHHVTIDPDRLTMGLFADLDSGHVATIITALADVIIESDLPGETAIEQVRKLTRKQFAVFCAAVAAAAA